MITVTLRRKLVLKALGYTVALLLGASIFAYIVWVATANQNLTTSAFWGNLFLGILAVLIDELKKREALLAQHTHERSAVAVLSDTPVLIEYSPGIHQVGTQTTMDLTFGGVALHLTRATQYTHLHDNRPHSRITGVLSLAQEEAERLQHHYIGTEHLLLGLVREGEGVAAEVLSNLDVELNKVRHAVELIIGRGDRIVLDEIALTPRARKVIELAVDEARRLNHHSIGTEHLLLGLVREGEGIAAGILECLGVNLEKVRAQTIQVLSQSGASYEREETPEKIFSLSQTPRLTPTVAAMFSPQEDAQVASQYNNDPLRCYRCGSALLPDESFCGSCGSLSTTTAYLGVMPPIWQE